MVRPGTKDFLQKMAQVFEVVIYTASLPQYADPIINALDPTRTLIQHRLYRHHCNVVGGTF